MGSKVFWAIVVGFLVGVFARSFEPLGRSSIAFLVLLAGTALVLAFIERRTLLIVLGIACVSCALGVLRMDMATLTGDPQLSQHIGSKIVLEGMVVAEPDARATGIRAAVRVDTLAEKTGTTSVKATVLAILPVDATVQYGERVRVSGTLALPSRFDTSEGRSFAYPEYLGKDGIAYLLNRASAQELEPPRYSLVGTPNYFAAVTIGFKQRYLRGLAAVLPEPEASFAGGITVGAKRGIGSDLQASFQRDSLSHVIVLSGYNITVVMNAMAHVLSWAPRLMSFGSAVGIALFFMLVSGGAASAARAGLMALIAVYARMHGRIFLAERALGAVSVAMVAWNPWTLAFDPGFQLSALATLGLILFTPLVATGLHAFPTSFGIREVLSSTIATQIAVLPLLLYQSGVLSLVALPANMLALFPVPWAMFFSFVAGLSGMALGHLAAPFALPAYALLAYIIGVTRVLAALPFAAVSVPSFGTWWLAAAYAGIALLYAYTQRVRVTSK